MVKSACGIEAVYMCFNGTGIWGGETTYIIYLNLFDAHYETIVLSVSIGKLKLRCSSQSKLAIMSTFHDEIEIEDMEYDEDTEMYYYPCPCGDQFQISKVNTQTINVLQLSDN